MIPATFEYLRPQSLEEAVALLGLHGEDAKLLAGAHSLLPAMKLRLARPKVVIDLGRIADLNYIRETAEKIAIGPMTTHHDIEASALLRERCPLFPELAGQIGDVQVRNRGTIGGSVAHADPAADWPAAILALEADLDVTGPQGDRQIAARDFFVDLYQTALQPDELIREIRIPSTGRSVAYLKFTQRASGFAIAGVAVTINSKDKTVRIGITGVSAKPYRAAAVEEHLQGKTLTPENISAAAQHAADGVDPLGDIHASAEFRAHIARVNTARALELASSRT